MAAHLHNSFLVVPFVLLLLQLIAFKTVISFIPLKGRSPSDLENGNFHCTMLSHIRKFGKMKGDENS